MTRYGTTMFRVISVLNMEDSATPCDVYDKPLSMCVLMAMLNAMDTNPQFGRVMHDTTNEFFDGAFGEYQEPSTLERLGVRT